MKLRKLELRDAPLMLEWMHDTSVVENLQTDFASKGIEDCEAFIKAAQDCSTDLHLVIADEKDIYMGTVSLKHIQNGMAEFAIAVRKKAMGLGYSRFGMEEIIKIGFDELELNMIYWCVSPDNKRALRFYDKNNYKRVSMNVIGDFVWGGTALSRLPLIYGINRTEFTLEERNSEKFWKPEAIEYGYSFPSGKCRS